MTRLGPDECKGRGPGEADKILLILGGGRNSNKRNVFYVINLCWKLRIFFFFFPRLKTVGREQIYMFTQLIHDIIGRIWERGPRIRIGALGPLSLWSREWFANTNCTYFFFNMLNQKGKSVSDFNTENLLHSGRDTRSSKRIFLPLQCSTIYSNSHVPMIHF